MENILNKHIVILLYFILIAWFSSGCQKKGPHPPEEAYPSPYADENVKNTESEKALSSKKHGFYSEQVGKNLIHTIYKNNTCYYKSTFSREERIDNVLYPKIQDAFLFEDKFYMKVSFPIVHAGKVTFMFPEIQDYVMTETEPDKYQIVINDALDLNRIRFHIEYHPAKTDSLVKSSFSYEYVIFEE